MDLIDRQAVIDALVSETCYADEEEIRKACEESCLKQMEWIGGIYDAIRAVKEVNSAKRTVQCKDCIHWDDHLEECSNSDSVCFRNGMTGADWFCADAERKEID